MNIQKLLDKHRESLHKYDSVRRAVEKSKGEHNENIDSPVTPIDYVECQRNVLPKQFDRRWRRCI